MGEIDVLLLRLEAPLMSFGGVLVDQRGDTRLHPAQSMLTGLLANALGWHHRDFERLQRLQDRLRWATRRDRKGRSIPDFQTVDLGQDFLRTGWTTRGRPESRSGGSAKTATHIRYREYLADAAYTVALTLKSAVESPNLDTLESALREPARPLFLGRKPCIPARPILHRQPRIFTDSLHAALEEAAPETGDDDPHSGLMAWWPDAPGEPKGEERFPLTDERDWRNQVHVGRRFLWQGIIRLETAPEDEGTSTS